MIGRVPSFITLGNTTLYWVYMVLWRCVEEKLGVLGGKGGGEVTNNE